MKRFLIQSIGIIVISSIVGLLVNAVSSPSLPLIRPPDESDEKWTVVTGEEVLQHLQDGSAIFIDARDEKYFNEGHIPSAINLPASNFGEAFAEIGESLPREFFIIVYCQGSPCDESHDVLDHLELLGFQDLALYEGGWMEWEQNGHPAETSGE
ncbi:MAG: rhodanese-like domain-containing protein [Candidatus Omnitrophica bacterium]|nr:rhodanese-like domain-containing protein [Candidatus Omnitrophota bacterium]